MVTNHKKSKLGALTIAKKTRRSPYSANKSLHDVSQITVHIIDLAPILMLFLNVTFILGKFEVEEDSPSPQWSSTVNTSKQHPGKHECILFTVA